MKTKYDFGEHKDPNLETIQEQALLELQKRFHLPQKKDFITEKKVEIEIIKDLTEEPLKGYFAKSSIDLYTDKKLLGRATILLMQPGDGTGNYQENTASIILPKELQGMNPWVGIPRDKNAEDELVTEFCLPLGTYDKNYFVAMNSVWMTGYKDNNPEQEIEIISRNLGGVAPEYYLDTISHIEETQRNRGSIGVTLAIPENEQHKDHTWQKRFGAYHAVIIPSYYPEVNQALAFFQIKQDNKDFFNLKEIYGTKLYVSRKG